MILETHKLKNNQLRLEEYIDSVGAYDILETNVEGSDEYYDVIKQTYYSQLQRYTEVFTFLHDIYSLIYIYWNNTETHRYTEEKIDQVLLKMIDIYVSKARKSGVDENYIYEPINFKYLYDVWDVDGREYSPGNFDYKEIDESTLDPVVSKLNNPPTNKS